MKRWRQQLKGSAAYITIHLHRLLDVICLSSAATSSFPRLPRLTALTLGEGEFTCSPGLFCDLWDETLMALLQ